MSANHIYSNTPYTYLIGWSKQNLWYYGVRFAKNCNPNDLFIKYFTSSKYVKDTIAIYGNPDIIQIRKTFSCINKAREWEKKVLIKIKAKSRNDFLNRSDVISIRLPDDYVYTPSKEHLQNLSKRMTENNPMKNKKSVNKMINSRKGRPAHNKGKPNPVASERMKESNPMKNKDSIDKMLAARKAKTGLFPSTGTFWLANIFTKKRKRVSPEDIAKFCLKDGWIRLSNKLPIPDHIQAKQTPFDASTPASERR